MARGIDENDVWQAADALLMAGQRPTIERIRQKIGRGSPNTVSPLLETWFLQLGRRLRGTDTAAPVPEPPGPVQAAAALLWEQALEAARVELERVLEARRAELTALEKTLARERERLEAEAARLVSLERGLEEAVRVATGQLGEANRRIAAQEASLERRGEEFLQAQAQIQGLEGTQRDLHERLEEERTRFEVERAELMARAAATERRANEEIDRARLAARRSEEELGVTRQQAGARIEELAAQIRLLESDLGAERATLLQECARRDAALVQAQAGLARAEALLEAVRTDAALRETSWQSEGDSLRGQLGRALEQLRVKDEEHGALLRSLVERAASSDARVVRQRETRARKLAAGT